MDEQRVVVGDSVSVSVVVSVGVRFCERVTDSVVVWECDSVDDSVTVVEQQRDTEYVDLVVADTVGARVGSVGTRQSPQRRVE